MSMFTLYQQGSGYNEAAYRHVIFGYLFSNRRPRRKNHRLAQIHADWNKNAESTEIPQKTQRITRGWIVTFSERLMELITSKHNAKVRLARSLLRPKGRREHGLFLVEGLRHVGAALEANADVQFLLWSPERLTSDFGKRVVEGARAAKIPLWAVSAGVLDAVSPREHSQGLIAVVRPHHYSLADLSPERHRLVVAVVAPQTPGNVGTILRTIDAVGAHALVLLNGGADPYSPAAVRASMGALFWVPLVQAAWSEFARWARRRGYSLVGTSARGGADYRTAEYNCPTVLLLGNERRGLDDEQRTACDLLVRIPMGGHGTSLNLAVAAGVMLYEMRHRCLTLGEA